jgi:S1-C subfamily serine protease
VALSGAIPDSPAEEAGVLPGDRLIRMAGFDIPNIEVFTRVLADHEVGERVEIEVLRGPERIRLWATFGSRRELWP